MAAQRRKWIKDGRVVLQYSQLVLRLHENWAKPYIPCEYRAVIGRLDS